VEWAIEAERLGKRFMRHHRDRPTTFKEALLRGLRPASSSEPFWALREVSFQVAPGRMLGVIGANGAGKSTLLRLVGGVGRPDEGSLRTSGRIGALLDVGADFSADLTGRENVYVSGAIAGLARREIDQRLEAIVAFAELEQFIDSPLRTYSSGMQMRLGFSVAVHTRPEILLIDEVLAVGDLAFQQKCTERIARFKADGCAILLVSHDPALVRELCDETLWLRAGRVAAHGNAETVVAQYLAELETETRRRTPRLGATERTATGTPLELHQNRFGSQELQITALRLLDPAGRPLTRHRTGDPLLVELAYHAPSPLQEPIFGLTISREDGLACLDLSTTASGWVQGAGLVRLTIDRLDLNGGHYFVDAGIYERGWAYAYDYHWHVYPLLVEPPPAHKGVLRPPHRWEPRPDPRASFGAGPPEAVSPEACPRAVGT
jgi:lipopolysaccharide transport system ATP-binding protein